jgi:hypothetical protein
MGVGKNGRRPLEKSVAENCNEIFRGIIQDLSWRSRGKSQNYTVAQTTFQPNETERHFKVEEMQRPLRSEVW